MLEIGAGAGSLTLGLARAARRVIAVEFDARIVPALRESLVGIDNVEVVEADAMKLDYAAVEATELVANLPYNIAVPLVITVLENATQISSLTVMTQREVGERLAATPGSKSYGQVSVLVGYWAETLVAARISRNAFYPVPTVDSVLVRLDRRDPPEVDYARLNEVVKTAFAQRRKTLRNTLGPLGSSVSEIEDTIRTAGIDPGARPETVSLDGWVAITRQLVVLIRGEPRMSRGLRLRTNAKTNLLLRVLGRRPDGYHEIETIFHTLSLADTISIEPTTSDEIEVDMHAESSTRGGLPRVRQPRLSSGSEADRGRRPNARGEDRDRQTHPHRGGLGRRQWERGGRSRRCERDVGARAGLGDSRRARIGHRRRRPLLPDGGTALATGLGERTIPLTAPETLWFALGVSNEPLLTRDVYGEFEAHRDAADIGSGPMRLALGQGDVVAVAALVHNDLEPPAFRLRPGLAQLKAAMLDAGALGAVMSGSGPTMVGLARDRDHATAIAEAAERSFDRVVVSSSRPVCLERLD